MAERPLLIFPSPQNADRDNLSPGFSDVVQPAHDRQSERVGPILQTLQGSFNERSVEIQQSTEGIDPEQVIVIETIGRVEDFSNAVRRIEGLEWLGDLDLEGIAPDEDFYDAKKKEKPLGGRLYLIMSNQAALNQMLTLWSRYQKNSDMKWEHGLAKFRKVYQMLKTIRRWGVEDRLAETGLIEAWEEDLEHFPDQQLRVEIDLWFRNSKDVRTAIENRIEKVVMAAGGRVLRRIQLTEIAYHGLLAELPRSELEKIRQDPATQLVKSDEVMFFRPVGQMAAGKTLAEGSAEDRPAPQSAPFPTGESVIAVLDGLPIENHELLADRLIVDDPDGFSPNYQVRDRNHGTAMCSLVVWGDLSNSEPPLSRPIYVRPIMKSVDWYQEPWPEMIPIDVLPIDIIHRAVRRIFEGDGDEPPAAPNTKIVNLSIGDPSRPFSQFMSPLARLLDWLSVKYDVLFVVSAGNQLNDIELGINETEFSQLSQNEKERCVIRSLYNDSRNRRIFSPAESINGLTVNSIHGDNSTPNQYGRLVDVFTSPLPSPASAFGGGHRRSIKPDLSFPGGRTLYNYTLASALRFLPRRTAPGNLFAAPGTTPGDNSKTTFGSGTSNSAALVSRHLGICHDELLELFSEQAGETDPGPFMASLLKTLVVHACAWDDTGERLRELLSDQTNGNSVKHWIGRWLGYGMPDVSRLVECTEQRATVFGFGELTDGKGHVFSFPLPSSLGSKTARRRLTVTLGWMSPIVPTNQKYRNASLWFELPNKGLTPTRVNAEYRAARRGTVQHEVFEGEDAIVIANGDQLLLKVNCRADAGKLNRSIKYGFAATLEVGEGINVPIFDEVQAGIRTAIELATQARVSSS